MKKLTLIAAMASCIAYTATAQIISDEDKVLPDPSKTESEFNMPQQYINVRDYVLLPNNAKIIVELNNPAQYSELKNIDDVLKNFMKEIAFYRDSLENGSGSVRIDYTLDEAFPFSKIRFKKHAADGDIFMNRNNNVSRLKVDQDTVHIYVRHNPIVPPPDHTISARENRHAHSQFYQLTFCVNNYTDINKIIADKENMQHAFDTILATKKKSAVLNPYKFPSSTEYRAETPNAHFIRFRGMITDRKPSKLELLHTTDVLSIDGNIGIGLLRNAFAPYAEIGLSLTFNGRSPQNKSYTKATLRLFESYYVLFGQNASNEYFLKETISFANASISINKDMAVGAGYMVSGNNVYFKGHTAKLFMNIPLLKKGLTLSPEFIATNNFKEIFPALTLKVF